MTIPVWVTVTVSAMLAVSIVLVLVCLLRARTLLDRVLAVDTLLTMIVCGTGVYMAVTADSSFVPVLLALSLLAFIGSVSVARLGPVRDYRGGKR